MDQGYPSFAVQCTWIHAAVFVDALVEPIELTVGPGGPDMVGHRLRECAKLRFAGSQDFLSDAPFVYVAKDGGYENARLAHPARKRHHEIGRRAILTPRHHLDRLADDVAVEDRASRVVPGGAILEKKSSGPTDQLFRRIAELPVRGGIGELNGVLVARTAGEAPLSSNDA